MLLHTSTCTRSHTQTLIHTEAFAHRCFPHRSFYTQTLLHTEAFTHRSFYTQMLLHTDTFTHRTFNRTNHSNLVSCERVAAGPTKVAKKTPVFDTRTLFRTKGLPRKRPNRNLTAVFDDQTSFRAKGLPPKCTNFTTVF